MPERAQRDPQPLQVYYDGSCPLCSAEIAHYKRQDRAHRLDFVDVSREGVNPGPDLAPANAMKRFHVRQKDGTLLSGAKAFAAIWHVLPGWKWAARLAQVPGMTAAMELGYKAFLPVRPILSRGLVALGAKSENPCRKSK
ncbi:DUF393 domain-containing protein [Rhodobacteraceae bacterium]|nr:DUF393 domain-containing protein [Paracoccaceae bacterium]